MSGHTRRGRGESVQEQGFFYLRRKTGSLEANLSQQNSATCLRCGEWENEQPALEGALKAGRLGGSGEGLG